MASPYLSERVSAAILRSLCSEQKKDHGKKVVSCMEKQRVTKTYGGEEVVLSFADVVDDAGYIEGGMIDDFFPRYPYKTTRNSWWHFKTIYMSENVLLHALEFLPKVQEPNKTPIAKLQAFPESDGPKFSHVIADGLIEYV